MLAFAVGYGLAYGGNGALLSPLTAALFGREQSNAVSGLLSLAFAVSGLLAPRAVGATYDALGTYDPAFVAAIVGAVAIRIAGGWAR